MRRSKLSWSVCWRCPAGSICAKRAASWKSGMPSPPTRTGPAAHQKKPGSAGTAGAKMRRIDSSHQLSPLRRVLDRMGEERARQVLAFLQHPEWEATNNGAERGGRQFRHLQASCFKLRTEAAIDGALKAWAIQTKEARTTHPGSVGRSRRGRQRMRSDGQEGVSVAA